MSPSSENNLGVKAVLSIPNFRNLWLGQAISQIGDGLANLAQLFVINQLTGSTTAMAAMVIAIAVPQLLFGLVAGVFVDRWDRKRIMIVSDIVRGLLVLGFIFVQRAEDVWLFYVLGFAQASVSTFFDPAESALIPALVERKALLAANGLSQTTRVITNVIGAALAGLLLGLSDSPALAFGLDALSFFVSALFIARIHVAPTMTRTVESGVRRALTELAVGLRYLLGERLLAGVMVTFAVTMLGLGAVNVLFMPFLVNVLSMRVEVLGIVEAAQVVGMVVGSGLIVTLATRLKAEQIIGGGVIAVGLCMMLVGAAPAGWVVLIGLFGAGLAIAPIQAAASTLMQSHVPDDKRGRAGSALNTVITLASVISMGAAGVLGDVLGIRQVFYLAGGITIFAGFLAAVLMRTPTLQTRHSEAI